MKKTLKILISLTITVIVIYACHDGFLYNDSDNDSENISLKIEEAKSWYESNSNDAILLKSAKKETLPVTFYANWAEACQRKGKKCETVEVALMSTGKLNILAPETFQEYETSKNEKLKSSFTRLVVRSDKKSKKKNGFLMTIIPSLEYFKATNFHPFHSTYLDVDKDFSGLIIYHNLDGSFSNGWKYQSGKITHTVSQVSGSDLNLKSGYYDCHIESYYEVYETCTEWHTWTEYGDKITDETCEYDYVLVEYEVCDWIEDPDDGGGGGYLGDTQTKLEKLALSNTLNPTQTALLEAALDEWAEGQCLDGAVYNYLLDVNAKMNFTMDANLIDPAGYDPVSKTLKFRNNSDINSENLKEELFHAMQDNYYSGGTAQYLEIGKVNIEFEAKVFKDIAMDPLSVCCYAFFSNNVPNQVKMDYMLWIYEIRENYSSLTDSQYQDFLCLFNLYLTDYSSQVSTDLLTPSLIRKLNDRSNCLN